MANLARSLSWQLGRFNIRINAINPGLIETSMNKDAFEKSAARGTVPGLAYTNALSRHAEHFLQDKPRLADGLKRFAQDGVIVGAVRDHGQRRGPAALLDRLEVGQALGAQLPRVDVVAVQRCAGLR